MSSEMIQRYGDELFEALRGNTTVAPLTERESELDLDTAYRISLHLLQRRLDDGEAVIGKKIGVTSQAVQDMLDVRQPDFGYLTDRMVYADGDTIPIADNLIAPRAEGEIAFVLKRDLRGPGVTSAEVLAATDFVFPCFEIVDSRIQDWRIRIQDTVADNASCGVFALGDTGRRPAHVDLGTCGMVMEKNGVIVATGAGAAALGSPLNCVAWLANTLGRLGVPLKAGEVILSGSLVPLVPVASGDHIRVTVGDLGSCSLRFG
ncbi:MAG: 2-oxopent-4-enoate hydratase [Alcanivorax sp.]|nr:2-oxopent-4-enoate hydratase [Alcanivorax sp.]